MSGITSLVITPVSLVRRDGFQRIRVEAECDSAFHGTLRATDAETGNLLGEAPVALTPGKAQQKVMLPAAERDYARVIWELTDKNGNPAVKIPGAWKKPREWTLYFMISSHTDIGLHNSQYIQRYNSSRFLDMAMRLCDETADRPEEDRYRYVVEGSWFFENYPADRGEEAARRLVEEYVRTGKIGVCSGIAGNHTHVLGLEELNRLTDSRARLKERWGIDSHTLSMIDNNGLSWGIVQPFAEAGYENIIFAPNQWNPLYSTVWEADTEVEGFTWNCEAGGGGSRIDMRFDSALPRVFFWESAQRRQRLLVWSGGNYGNGAAAFGLDPNAVPEKARMLRMENALSRTLPRLEARVPYDLWLTACYHDDQEPGLSLTDSIAQWNREWLWPRFRTCGNPDEPFNRLKESFGDSIPVLRGEITGGWYQHPLSAAELLTQKMEAERILTEAETLSSLACVVNPQAEYPATEFERAWHALLLNDEHSYGVSGYQGRRVYETWIQHRDWIDGAEKTGRDMRERALGLLAGAIGTGEDSVLVFNPASQDRSVWAEHPEGKGAAFVEGVPALGYRVIPQTAFEPMETERLDFCPEQGIENRFYRIRFAENGSIRSIYDLELDKELLDLENEWGANAFVYTQDNHLSFVTQEKASFAAERTKCAIRIVIKTRETRSRAEITQILTLREDEKRIDIENRLEHVRDLFNTNRYYRYAYQAFPFKVEKARRLCHLNGCVAEYGADLTGHTTDTYMSARDWCAIENDTFGVGFLMPDNSLVEFDHIHPDKTDYGDPGEGSPLYVYLANDWLQMHVYGGEALNYTFRYAITSYACDGRNPGYLTAGLAETAQRFVHPVLVRAMTPHEGTLGESECFLRTAPGVELVNLKRAKNGEGLIARLYALKESPAGRGALTGGILSLSEPEENTPNEWSRSARETFSGFETLRIGSGTCLLNPIPEAQPGPLEIGSGYTGLLRKLSGARGEHDGHIYLLWGALPEASAYEVYRGTESGFEADDAHRAAVVAPEEFVTARYEDTGLEKNTVYYYRVRALDREGRRGPLSEEIAVHTKE